MMIWQRFLAENQPYREAARSGWLAGMRPFLAVRRSEWAWVAAWSVIILSLASLPYLYGLLLSTPTNQFGGFVIGVEDGYSYLGKMRLGAESGLKFYLFYTSEPHEGTYLMLFYLLLGKVAYWSGLSFLLVYHLARLIFGFLLLATIYSFIAFFTDLRPVRQLAFLLVAVGSGLGWLVTVMGLVERIGLPLDFYSPEAFAFHLLLGLPHLSLSLSLLLWAIMLVILAWEARWLGGALLAGVALLAMGSIAAFYIVVAGMVFGVGVLLRAGYRWRQGTGPRSEVLKQFWVEAGLGGLALLIALPFTLYNLYVFTTNPVFKVWSEQNTILSPSPLHYVLAFGLLVLPAVIGAWQAWRQGDLRQMVLVGWCLALPCLVYFPFNLQRRLALGVQVPLAILAVLGIWWLWQRWKQRESIPWRLGLVGLVFLLSLSNLVLLLGLTLEVGQQRPPLFHSGALIEAADWLAAHGKADEVVLAAYETANYLPVRRLGRVFVGHGPETIYSEAKKVMLAEFFKEANEKFRRQLLQEYGITYLFYGAAERALGDFSPEQAPYLEQVYDNGAVQIYQVRLGE